MIPEPQVMPPSTLSLTIPNETSALVANSDQFAITAEAFVIDSEVSFQMADEMQADWKAVAKAINDKRMELTKPLDKAKELWMNFFRPAIDGRTKAAATLQQKMSAYRRQEREKAEAARRQAEELARKEREKLEAEARRREEAAAKLKTRAGREKAQREAEELRQTAQMMPETFAVSAPEPQTSASNVAQIWDVEEIADMPAYLRWLADRPEWHVVLGFKDAEHKRLAKQFHSIGVPGLKFIQRDSFRSKARR